VRALLAARAPPPGAPEPSFAERRAGMDSFGDLGSLPSGCFHEPMFAGQVKCERVAPQGVQDGRTLLYLHGGGYTIGSPRSHRPLAARLADAAQAIAIVPDYRLGPEHRFPAAVDDAVEVYRHLLRNGAEPERLVVAGDSAGGGLALALALALKEKAIAQPAGYFVISPWADLTQTADTYRTRAEFDPMITKPRLDMMAEAYLGGLDAHDPLASPVYGDFTGCPPVLIHVGSEEALLGDSLKMADVLAHARVQVRLEVWPEMIHVWHAFSGQLGAARRAIAEGGDWLAERMA
jgi:monoterpene epsilon-lactone hydrolase